MTLGGHIEYSQRSIFTPLLINYHDDMTDVDFCSSLSEESNGRDNENLWQLSIKIKTFVPLNRSLRLEADNSRLKVRDYQNWLKVEF